MIKRLHLQNSSGQGPLPHVSKHQLSVEAELMDKHEAGSTGSFGGAPSRGSSAPCASSPSAPMTTTEAPSVTESLMSSAAVGLLTGFDFIFVAGGCLANHVAECFVEACLAIHASECFDFDVTPWEASLASSASDMTAAVASVASVAAVAPTFTASSLTASATSALLALLGASHWQICFGQRPVEHVVWHQ